MHRLVLILLIALTAPAFAQRDLKDIPDPDPEIERKSFIVADGFEVNLFAADPQIAKPIQMNFDAAGRLWIASSEIYPHIKPGQKADDKILVLEDKDGDGRADSTDVFARGLLIPTGVLPGDGGVYVANSTELLHLSDTDGDGQADRRRIVLSGFGTEDTHHLLHTLRWGPDGAMYMNQSIYIHSHIETPYGVRHLNGGGIWRFEPDTLKLDVVCRGFVNPWGHHFTRWGANLATDGAYGEGINYVFPGAVFVTAPGAKRRLRGLNPGSPKHCGLELLSGRHLPDEFQGNAITNDFRGHRVCRFILREDGSGFASRQATELIKTRHVAFRPIDVKMGPDGAIYIADWYNPIIQHGEVNFRDPRRDHVHGRIWRVTAKGRPLVPRPKLEEASTAELLDHLRSPEQFTRLHAKLVLKSRGAEQTAEPLRRWVESIDGEDDADEHQRLEALWLFQALGVVEKPLLQRVLNSPQPQARAAAVRVASHWREHLDVPLNVGRAALKDDHARVRLEGVRMLAQTEGRPGVDAARIAMRAYYQPMDRFLDFALWQAMRDLAPAWLPAAREGGFDFGNSIHLTYALKAVDSPDAVKPLLLLIKNVKMDGPQVFDVLRVVASLGGSQDLKQVFDVVVERAEASPATAANLLTALAEASKSRKLKPAGDLKPLEKLAASDDDELRAAAFRAAGTWGLANLADEVSAMARADTPETVVLAAIDALGGYRKADDLAAIAASKRPTAVRRRAILALAEVAPQRAAAATAHWLETADAKDGVEAVVGAIVARKGGAEQLAAALKTSTISPDAAKRAISAAQRAASPSQPLLAALRTAGKLADHTWKLTPQLMAELVKEVANSGDPHRGEEVYRRTQLQCMNCHAIGGAGGRVGPDLSSIGGSAQVDYLIESLIEPNKKVKENFHSLQVQTEDGKVLAGIPIRDTAEELVLRDAEDKIVTLPAGDVAARKPGRSLMPDGTVDAITRGELVDLARFLSELGKVGDFALGKDRVVRTWRSLVWTQEAHYRLNRTSYDTAATDDPALTWTPVYSRVDGSLPTEGLARFVPQREQDPAGFVRCRLDVTTAGKIALKFNSKAGLTLWVDGRPTGFGEPTILDLPTGEHTLTLAVVHAQRDKPLRIELLDVPDSPAQAEWASGK